MSFRGQFGVASFLREHHTRAPVEVGALFASGLDPHGFRGSNAWGSRAAACCGDGLTVMKAAMPCLVRPSFFAEVLGLFAPWHKKCLWGAGGNLNNLSDSKPAPLPSSPSRLLGQEYNNIDLEAPSRKPPQDSAIGC